MNKLCYKSKFVNSWGKINSKWKAMAKNNQKIIIWDILQGAKKRIHPLTYYSKSGGPFFKSHPVQGLIAIKGLKDKFIINNSLK